MRQTITAIYENGVLRPLIPLDLPEHTQVEIELHPAALPAHARDRRAQVRAALTAAGLVAAAASAPPTASLSAAARASLAARLGAAGGPALSTTIIEERQEQ